jgi:hypothetical protein
MIGDNSFEAAAVSARATSTIRVHIRWAIPDDGRIPIIEPFLPPTVDGSMPATVYLTDLNLLVNVLASS